MRKEFEKQYEIIKGMKDEKTKRQLLERIIFDNLEKQNRVTAMIMAKYLCVDGMTIEEAQNRAEKRVEELNKMDKDELNKLETIY